MQILHRRYWNSVLATRIGQQITVHHDERTLQRVYAEIDGQFVILPVVGDYPDISEPEWEAERQRLRRAGAAFQADGARAATARYIQAARREVAIARHLTASSRQERKQQEREGVSHGPQVKGRIERAEVQWVPSADLPDDDWLKWHK